MRTSLLEFTDAELNEDKLDSLSDSDAQAKRKKAKTSRTPTKASQETTRKHSKHPAGIREFAELDLSA